MLYYSLQLLYSLLFLYHIHIRRKGLNKLGVTDEYPVMYSGDIEYRPNAFKASANVLRTKVDLVELCTKIIFATTVKHAAVNFLQWDYASFAPVSPMCMRGTIPNEDDRGKVTEKHIINSLPDRKNSIRAAGVAFALTEFSPDEVYLLLPGAKKRERSRSVQYMKILNKPTNLRASAFGSTQNLLGIGETNLEPSSLAMNKLTSQSYPPRWLFNEEEVKTAFTNFQNKLHKIEYKIQERNFELDVPYEVLLPSQIPSGIAI